jgi:hypothetical protein
MKPILLVLALFFIGGAPAAAQKKAPWPEMEAFHQIMSKTFHPVEKGDFAPIRSRSGEMVDKAVAWKTADAPAGYDKNAIKKQLKQLVKDAKKLHQLIQHNGSDADVKARLVQLHDLFHAITEKCEGGDDH